MISLSSYLFTDVLSIAAGFFNFRAGRDKSWRWVRVRAAHRLGVVHVTAPFQLDAAGEIIPLCARVRLFLQINTNMEAKLKYALTAFTRFSTGFHLL